MRPSVTYTLYDTPWREQSCNIITFEHFEEGNILSETRNDAESGDESEDDSIMPPLLSNEEMDVMDSGNESDDEPMSTKILGEKRNPQYQIYGFYFVHVLYGKLLHTLTKRRYICVTKRTK